MEQLRAFECHQNVAEPRATENHIKYSTLAIFFYMRYSATGSLHRAIVWSPVTNTGTVSQATKTNRIDGLPCSYDIALATE